MKKEMLAMILAGGQGSRLGVFTKRIAKPAVSFGGKYRIIDFVLSNCSNSGIDTVGEKSSINVTVEKDSNVVKVNKIMQNHKKTKKNKSKNKRKNKKRSYNK